MKRTIAVIVALLLLSVPASAMKLIYGATGDIAQVSGGPTQFVAGFTTGLCFEITKIKSGALHVYASGDYAENNDDFTQKYGAEVQGILFVNRLKEKRGGNLFLILGANYDWLDMAATTDLEKILSATIGFGYRYAVDPTFVLWAAIQDYSTFGAFDKDDDYNAVRIGIGVGIEL